MTLYVRYRDQREVRRGRHGEVTVDQTRRRAQDIRVEARSAAERDRLQAVPTFADFVEDRWGSRRLDEVKSHDLAALQDALRSNGLFATTLNRYTAFVRRVYNLALRWGAY